MALPQGYMSERQYFDEVLSFLKKYHWIYSSPNTHIFANKILNQISPEWISYLTDVSNSEFECLALCEFSVSMESFLDAIFTD